MDIAVPQDKDSERHHHISKRIGLFRLVTTQGDHITTFHIKPAVTAKKLSKTGRK